MFNKEITNSDPFLDMPLSSQCLYFHLGMNADDDWFVSPKSIIRLVWAKEDDLKVLITKWFTIPFNDSVIVITHWKLNNNIRSDRYTPTVYKQHLKNLVINYGAYQTTTIGMLRIGKDRIEESSIEESNIDNIYIAEEKKTDTNNNEFELFWKYYPHARKWKKNEAKTYFIKNNYDDVMKEVSLMVWKVKIWLDDWKFIPACERWIRDFTPLADDIREQTLKAIVYKLMTIQWDNRKLFYSWLVSDFWKDKIDVYVKNWNKEKNWITLDLK